MEQSLHPINKFSVVPRLLGSWRRQGGLRGRVGCVSTDLVGLALEQDWGLKCWSGVSWSTWKEPMTTYLEGLLYQA